MGVVIFEQVSSQAAQALLTMARSLGDAEVGGNQAQSLRGKNIALLTRAPSPDADLFVAAVEQLGANASKIGGDMLAVAKPWTKWAVEVERVEDLPAATRRAIQTALTPPTGPVFMSIPVDVQLELTDAVDVTPARLPDRRVRPPLDALRRAAEVLIDAKNPAILVGSPDDVTLAEEFYRR